MKLGTQRRHKLNKQPEESTIADFPFEIKGEIIEGSSAAGAHSIT